MLEVWGRKNANQVIQVLWTLAELGLEYKRYSVGVSSGDLYTDEYRALNPTRKFQRFEIMVSFCGNPTPLFVIWPGNMD